jgi:imidazolonepropionase-like amidohydrolase
MTARPSLPLLPLLASALVALDAQAETILFQNATLHPITGPEIPSGHLVVRDGKIVTVGTGTPAQTADQTIDLKGHHVFPGLIAPTTVLGLQEIDAVRATRDTTESGEYTPDVYSWKAVNPDSELIPVARANGYTHAQPIPVGGIVGGHSAVITLTAWTIEDMAFRQDAGLHVNWPGFGLDTTPKERTANKESWKSPEDQIKAREKRLRQIDDFFTEAEAYAKAKAANAPGFSIVPAWEAVLPVLKKEVPLFLHANEQRQIRSALEWAARRQYRAVLSGGRDAWRVADLLAKHKVPVVYEHVFTETLRDTEPYDVHFTAPNLLHKAGVEVSFSEGTDRFGASNVRNIPYAAAQARAFGLPVLEAHRGLTLYPARALGIADRVGSLEPGKDATFFVADGDILDLRAHVERMWIAGREVSLESRHTRLYDRYRQRPRK